MCRPVNVSRAEACPGGHIGPPLRGGGGVPNQRKIGAKTDLANGGTEPAPYRGSGAERSTAGCAWGVASASQIPKRNLGRQSWSPRPTGATQVVPSEEPMWASAPTKRRESFINHPGQRRTAERLRQRVRGNGWELRQRSSPKGLSTSDNPSVSLRLTAPFTQGSLWGRGMRIAASALRASSQ